MKEKSQVNSSHRAAHTHTVVASALLFSTLDLKESGRGRRCSRVDLPPTLRIGRLKEARGRGVDPLLWLQSQTREQRGRCGGGRRLAHSHLLTDTGLRTPSPLRAQGFLKSRLLFFSLQCPLAECCSGFYPPYFGGFGIKITPPANKQMLHMSPPYGHMEMKVGRIRAPDRRQQPIFELCSRGCSALLLAGTFWG